MRGRGAFRIDLITFEDGTELTIADINNKIPLFINHPQDNLALNEKAAWSYQLSNTLFSDPDGDQLSYKVTMANGSELPSWLSYDASTRTLSGTAGNSDVGHLNLKVIATDPQGLSAEQSFNITINNVNDAPIAHGSLINQTTEVGKDWLFNLPVGSFSDLDLIHGDQLRYSLKMADGSKVPSWLIINATTGAIQGKADALGSLGLLVIATDLSGVEATHALTLDVQSSRNIINGTEGNDILNGTAGDDAIYGGAGNDTITDNAGNNILDGGAGDDKITGKGIFIGGTGNDTLTAKVIDSTDTFIFNLGDGMDTIVSYDTAKTTDTLKFGEGITADMISYRKNGNHLIVVVGNQGDQITLNNYFLNLNYQTVNRFEFADGSVLEDIRQTKLTQYYTDRIDTITGTPWDDVIYGLGGDDTITDNAGNNILDGGEGNDKITGTGTLVGGAGTDTLTGSGTFIGGTGNDIINAKTNGSADTFILNLGDGQDTINGSDTQKLADTLKFGEGITKDMISYRKSGNHLIVVVGNQGDQITLTNYFYNLNNQTVNRFEFADGSVLEDIRQTKLTQYYTDRIDTITGTPWDDVIYGLGGNDTITDNAGNNILDGGEGNDKITGTGTLIGGAGTDTLTGSGTFIGGIGDDIIHANINGSVDTFMFNLGDGQDTINCLDTQKLTDTLKFGEGITADMISYRKNGNHLIIVVGNQGDQITLNNYFYNLNNQTVNRFEFADGTVWEDIRQTKLTQYYTNNADTITGTPWDDVIYGLGGNDTITDNAGNNILDGGEGNDKITGTGTLIGGAGTDTLTGSGTFIGGIGNDIINAKTNGSVDTFMFNLGDGQDTINCLDTQKLTDTLKFGDGITSNMVTHSQVGNNLILTVGNTGDKITVVSYFSGGNYRTLNQIEFADGTKWMANDQKGAAFGYQVTSASAPYAAPVVASSMLMSNPANSNLDTLTQEQQGLITLLESKEIIPETTAQQEIKLIPDKVLLDTVNNSMMDAPTEMLQAFIARSALKMQTAMDKKALASDTPSDHSPIIKLREKMIPIPPEKYLSTSMEQNPLTALYEADTYGANTGSKGMNADDARSLQSMVSAMAAFGTGTSSSNDLIDSDYSMAPRVFAPTN